MWFDRQLGYVHPDDQRRARQAHIRGEARIFIKGLLCKFRDDEFGTHVLVII